MYHVYRRPYPWWRHQMETFSALPVTDELPAQRPVTRSFDVFFDLRLNKRLKKQSWGWWFETPSCSLWRHCNARYVGADLLRNHDMESTGDDQLNSLWPSDAIWWCKCLTAPSHSQIARFMRPTLGPPGSCRPQMGSILAPWILLSVLPETMWSYYWQ